MGSIMSMAAYGDALGAPYEFNERLLESDEPLTMHPYSQHEAGRWTDDTSMALAIAMALVEHPTFNEATWDAVARNFRNWFVSDGHGCGNQTFAILSGSDESTSAADQRARAERYARRHDRAAGNGSLMRIHPVSLASDDRDVVAAIAREVTLLTYTDQRCLDISVLWCEVLRVARLTGEFRPTAGLDLLPAESHGTMSALIDEALATPSEVFSTQGWWVVPTFQQALSAVAHNLDTAPEATFAEIMMARESDTDTVCSIAGSVLGALGHDEVPAQDLFAIHGAWPRTMCVKELVALEDELLGLGDR